MSEPGSTWSQGGGTRLHFVVCANEVRQWAGGCFRRCGAAPPACLS